MDTVRVAYNDASDTDVIDTSGSATILLYLEAGQSVQIENQISSAIYGIQAEGFMSSWFSGSLVYSA